MSIEEKIREIAEAKFKGFSFVFEDWNTADSVVGSVDLPAILLILPVGGSLEFHNGRVRDEENTAIAFVDKVERDADGADNERVYTAMKRVAGQFIDELNKSGFFEPLDGPLPYYTIYERMAANVTGLFVDVRLKEKVGNCLEK
jgi:hypothetical protein